MKQFLSIIVLLTIFGINNVYANSDLANVTCAKAEDVWPETDYEDFVKTFGKQRIEAFENKYPDYDLSEFKSKGMSFQPQKGTHDDINPFVWLFAIACEDQEKSTETIGMRIEKTLLELPYVKKYRPKSYYPAEKGYNK